MNYYLEFSIYLISLLLPFVWSIKRYPEMDQASRMFCYITGISVSGEIIGLAASLSYGTNIPVYNVIGICNLVLLCLYFNYAIPVFRKHRVGIVLAVISVIVWTLSLFLFDTMHKMNTPYMFFESALTLGMAGFSIEQLLVKKSKTWIRLRNSPHFWFAWILFAYWCITITQWLMYTRFKAITEAHTWFSLLLMTITVLVNIAFFFIFFRYPKMQRQDVR